MSSETLDRYSPATQRAVEHLADALTRDHGAEWKFALRSTVSKDGRQEVADQLTTSGYIEPNNQLALFGGDVTISRVRSAPTDESASKEAPPAQNTQSDDEGADEPEMYAPDDVEQPLAEEARAR